MNKFLIAFAAVLAVCSSVNAYGNNNGYGNGYGNNYGSNIGAYQLQQQPAVTVQYLVPSYGGYGQNSYGQNSYGQNSYGLNGYGSIAIPSYGNSYGNSYGGVDAQAVNLAYQALNAPSAGLPQIADPVITPALISTYGPAYTSLPSYSAPAAVPAYGGNADSAAAASAAAAASNVANSNSVGSPASY